MEKHRGVALFAPDVNKDFRVAGIDENVFTDGRGPRPRRPQPRGKKHNQGNYQCDVEFSTVFHITDPRNFDMDPIQPEFYGVRDGRPAPSASRTYPSILSRIARPVAPERAQPGPGLFRIGMHFVPFFLACDPRFDNIPLTRSRRLQAALATAGNTSTPPGAHIQQQQKQK
jgi:hypothetical protein